MEKTDSEKKKEKGILSPLSKWVGTYVKTEKDAEKTQSRTAESGMMGVATFIFAFVLSRAEVFGGTMPFGLSYLAGSEKRVGWVLSGILLSSLYGEKRTIYLVAALLIAIIRLLVSYILEGRRERIFSEPLSLRLAVGAAGGFVSGIYGIFAGGFEKEQLLRAIFMIFAVPLAAYLYSGATGRDGEGDTRKELGSFALYLSFIIGLESFSLLGFSPALVVGSLITLTSALSGGSVKGGLIGMSGGLCMGAEQAVMLGLIGAITGSVRQYSHITAVGIGCVSGAIFALMTGGSGTLMTAVPALLWGGAICLPLVRFGGAAKLSILGSRTVMSEEASSNTMLISKKEEAMTSRLNALSEAMTSLSSVFYALSNRLTTPGAWQVRGICEASFKKYCKSCSQNMVCWGREYERTADVMNKLANAVVRHGNADSSYVPSHFLDVCPNTVKALSEVNLTHARLLESAAKQNKTEVFALDYEAMAKLLSEASEENSQEYVLDGALTEKARRTALDMGMGFHSIAVYGKRRKKVNLVSTNGTCKKDSDLWGNYPDRPCLRIEL